MRYASYHGTVFDFHQRAIPPPLARSRLAFSVDLMSTLIIRMIGKDYQAHRALVG